MSYHVSPVNFNDKPYERTMWKKITKSRRYVTNIFRMPNGLQNYTTRTQNEDNFEGNDGLLNKFSLLHVHFFQIYYFFFYLHPTSTWPLPVSWTAASSTWSEPCNRTRARTAIRSPAISWRLSRPGRWCGPRRNTCPRKRTAILCTRGSSRVLVRVRRQRFIVVYNATSVLNR